MNDVTYEQLRRIDAAIDSAGVSRAEVFLALPECHKRKCQSSHPNGDEVFGLLKRQIREAIHAELQYRTTTRPDLGIDDEPDAAVLTLAHLMSTYNVHEAGTYVRAAQLLVEAYPAIGKAIEKEDT
ncbi:hypothetical protein [Curtobacterium sp. MCBA15_004]|uniref:hypothetical protein n=1 Tax=Curtobacterium sp. MCBA15_004 TaxID=1898733 RepID=UPI001115005F|nr:hypothetical protein [Curtobacterium sp. MCBA15_004]WIA95827.1 hypothetical protein QOL16_11980 [Curtobacterium sp. MCBA15_004]